MTTLETKQVIVVRYDLKMDKGKMASQVAHASLEAAMKCDQRMLDKWRESGMKKVVLRVGSEHDLVDIYEKARRAGVKAVLVQDAGKTAFKKPTRTCVGIGPDSSKRIDRITGELKLL